MWTLRLRECGRSAGFDSAKVTKPSQVAPALKASKSQRFHGSPFEAIGPVD